MRRVLWICCVLCGVSMWGTSTPAIAEEGDLYYYSRGRKVPMRTTEYAVVRVKKDRTLPLLDFAPRLGGDRGEGHAYAVASVIQRGREYVVSTRQGDPQMPSVYNLPKTEAEQIEYVLPVLTRGSRVPQARERLRSRDLVVMTPQIVVRLADGADPAAFAAERGLRVVRKLRVPGAYMFALDGQKVTHRAVLDAANRAWEQGAADGSVLYSHPDLVPVRVRLDEIQDPRFANQWHLHNTGYGHTTDGPTTWPGKADADVDALEAWRITEGDPSIRVAILDDSVQKSHPDLQPNYQAGRYYESGSDPTPDPSPRTGEDRHGTACAGVAVGAANAIGGRGVAPRCGLIGVNMFRATGSQTADAFMFCDDPDGDPVTDDGASVVSCSWSSSFALDVELDAMTYLAERGRKGKGVLILFAAGNDQTFVLSHPEFYGLDYQPHGRHPAVICVGATDFRDRRSYYSNFGPDLDVVAPSSSSFSSPGIDTTDNTDDQPKKPGELHSGYAVGDYTGTDWRTGFGGTSSATPLVAGICGLVLSVNPNLTARQVRMILQHTADRVLGGEWPATYDPTVGHCAYYGYGRVNARAAVQAALTASRDPADLWPDRVSGLKATSQDALVAQVEWTLPPSHADGVLVVRSDQPIRWRPRDGERFQAGDLVGDGTVRVLLAGHANSLIDTVGGALPHYAVYPFSSTHKYGWGAEIRLLR